MSNHRISVMGLSAQQIEELQYRMQNAAPGHFAGVFDPDEGIFALMLFMDELTMVHTLNRERMIEVGMQLIELATGARPTVASDRGRSTDVPHS